VAFVVDASVVLAWLLPDEGSALAERMLARLNSETAQAPALLHYEVGNALLQAGRRRRFPADALAEMRAAFFALPIALDGVDQRVVERATELALRHSLSLYDACYLELALRRGLGLATLDDALRGAAQAQGVRLLSTEQD
jgi:predicted nucleic acid-binding protein